MAIKRILIVDDEPDLAHLLKRGLEFTEKFEVRVENSAKEAVTAAREFMPDLVLLDVMMPEMDGGEVAARFAKDEKLKHIPIFFLTAIVKEDELAKGSHSIGGRKLFTKPVNLDQLIAAIDEVLGE